MKRVISVLLIIINVFAVTAFADDGITVYLNDDIMNFEQEPIIRNDSTLVPFRAIFESLGMTVQWFQEEQRVTAQDDEKAITLFIDRSKMYVNKDIIELNTPPIIYNDYTMVPLRAVSEAAGAEVNWDGDTRTVYITGEVNDFDEWARLVLVLTNEERAKEGLNPLTWDDSLAALAKAQCIDMIERDYFSHNNPDGETPFDRIKKAGISYRSAGENIAAGQFSPEAVVKEWMESEGHRKNILREDFTHLGVSVVRGGTYGIYWTQEFVRYKESEIVNKK